MSNFTAGHRVRVLKDNWSNYPDWQDVIDGTFVVDHATILNGTPGVMCWSEKKHADGLYYLMDEHIIGA